MVLASKGTQRLRNGAAVVRLAPQLDGVVVDHGELRVLLHPDGALAAVSGTLLPAPPAPSFVSSPREALDRALDQHYGNLRARPAIAAIGDRAGWQMLGVAPDPQLQVTEARARPVLAREGGTLIAAWEVEVFGDAAPDPLGDPSIPELSARRHVIADAGGKVISDTDLTQQDAFVYRVYAETTGVRRPIDGPLTDFSPHPTGVPDGSAPTGFVDWGDFNGLLLQLREGDNRDGTYAQGSYADANGTPNAAYFSIRRFPCSRDRAKNDLSFRHIADNNPLPTQTPGRPNGAANSEVHNAGEVRAAMLWEAFNLLIDEHGVPVARRRITDYVVAGLLLTPPEATFTEGRDAILAAASALDTDDMLRMAAASSGRGAGSCAVSPSNAVRTNIGVIESGTLAARLGAGNVGLADDVVSRDNDGILEPGESGLLRVTLSNGGPLAAEEVRVTATTANVGVQIGAPVSLPLLNPFASADLTIPVRLLATAPPGTSLTITLRIVGEQTCDRDGITLVLTTPAAGAVDASTTLAEPSIASDAAMVSRVVATHEAPAASLRAADRAVCIMNDTP